jgi:hypothetical protein
MLKQIPRQTVNTIFLRLLRSAILLQGNVNIDVFSLQNVGTTLCHLIEYETIMTKG